jgi:cytochrome P450
MREPAGADGSYPTGATVTLDQLAADPYSALAQLTAAEPVSWLPAINGWLVTSRALAIDVLRDAEVFTVDDPRFSTAQVIGPSMLSLDGAPHLRHRMPFVDPFRSAEVRRRFAAWTAARATALVREIERNGHAELRSALAAPLAADVMTHALSLVGLETRDLLDIYNAIVAAVDAVTAGGAVPEMGHTAFASLRAAVEATMRDRPDSLPARARDGSDLTDAEITSNIAVLLFGGIVTTEGTSATLLFHVLEDPDRWNALQSDRSLIPAAVEEALRIEPAAAVVDRYATRDTLLGTARVRASDLVRVSLTAAGRDPAAFVRPDDFDLLRANAAQHLAFARGPHACLGVHLARLEARTLLDAALSWLPGLRFDPDASDPPQGLVFRSPARVTATWDLP